MANVEFQRALKAAQDELEQAITQQEATAKRILELRQVITSLSNALKEQGEKPQAQRASGFVESFAYLSLMDEIRGIFNAKPREVLTAQDVVDELTKLGHDIKKKYQQPLATIGVMLGRLKDQGDIVPATYRGKRGFAAKPRLGPRK